MIDLTLALSKVRRLSGMEKWPFHDEGQAELARIVSLYARDATHADLILDRIAESGDRCPTPQALKYELRGPIVIPAAPKTCRVKQCDGSGWQEVFMLHTTKSMPGGSAYKEKTPITREQYEELSVRIDWAEQQVFTGVRSCPCRTPKMIAA